MTTYYTRRGDDGTTGWLGEGRLAKDHPRLEAVGAIDEATAALGLARACCHGQDSGELIVTVQRDLYHLMAELAASPENAARFRKIDAGRVAWLEEKINEFGQLAHMPRDFIIPGDSLSGAAMSLARTVVRRAERLLVTFAHQADLQNEALLHYLNRLSSLCFVLEIYENQAAGKTQPTLAKE